MLGGIGGIVVHWWQLMGFSVMRMPDPNVYPIQWKCWFIYCFLQSSLQSFIITYKWDWALLTPDLMLMLNVHPNPLALRMLLSLHGGGGGLYLGFRFANLQMQKNKNNDPALDMFIWGLGGSLLYWPPRTKPEPGAISNHCRQQGTFLYGPGLVGALKSSCVLLNN